MFEFLAQPQHGWKFIAILVLTTVVFVAVMAAIHVTSTAFKKRLTMALAFLGGLYYLVEFILPSNIIVGRPHRQYLVAQSVAPGSAVAALQAGDILQSWNGVATPSEAALARAVSRSARGATVAVEVLRANATTPVTVSVAIPPAPAASEDPVANLPMTPAKLGLAAQKQSFSAVIRSVKPEAPAGLQPGDNIVAWGDAPTPDFPSLKEAVAGSAPGAPVSVTYFRDDAPTAKTLTVTMPPAPADPDGSGPQPAPPLTPRLLGLDVQNTANPLSPYLTPLASAQRVFLALALMLGIVNLFRINGRMVIRRRQGWGYAFAFFAGFLAMMLAWGFNYYQPGVPTSAMPVVEAGATPTRLPATEAVLSVPAGTPLPVRMIQYKGWYDVMFKGFFTGLSATMFSMLAFFIVSAAYRAFRVRSMEAVLLLGSALIMMLGLTPLGTALITGPIPESSFFSFLKLEKVSEWILVTLNGAAQRALLFGIAVGLMATSLRIWLSLERGQFFDAEM